MDPVQAIALGGCKRAPADAPWSAGWARVLGRAAALDTKLKLTWFDAASRAARSLTPSKGALDGSEPRCVKGSTLTV